jgi:hypothetical protein
MKKALLAFVIFSSLYLIGCDENSITDPVSSQSINKVEHKNTEVFRGIIPLDRNLVLPNLDHNYYHINGSIRYTEELLNFDPKVSASNKNVELDILLDAKLTDTSVSDHQENTWGISSESKDEFYVSEEGIYVLEKSYRVPGRTDLLILDCKFIVTTDGVGLNSIKLDSRPN